MISFPRKTISEKAYLGGKGLHSGIPVEVMVSPGDEGIVFVSGETTLKAIPENVSDTLRCTCLGPIATVEHIMSAFGGLGITDAVVEVHGSEMPALDGGASAYVDALLSAGVYGLGEAQIMVPYARVFHVEGEVRIAIARGEGHWRYVFEAGERWPHTQAYETFVTPARTFAYEEQVEGIRRAGLAQGLDETSALVLGRQDYVNEALFPDEPARHKLLDLIGDLYLSGVPVSLLNVVAERSGHRTNVEAARKLADAVKFTH